MLNRAPNHFHPLHPLQPILTHSHSFSAQSHQLWLISSPHLPTHTHFLRVVRVHRLYALIWLMYVINLRVYVLNVCRSILTLRFTNPSVITINAFNVSKCFTFLLAPCAFLLTCLHVSHACKLYASFLRKIFIRLKTCPVQIISLQICVNFFLLELP